MEFINEVLNFFNQILDWINTGIYEFFTKTFAQFVIWSTVAMIKFKIEMMGFAWDVAQQILNELSISSYISTAFGSLDGTTFSALSFFRVPEAVHIITSAYVTRFVLNFMGL